MTLWRLRRPQACMTISSYDIFHPENIYCGSILGDLTHQISVMEQSLLRLKQLMPEMPVLQVLISRLLVMMGREQSAMMEKQLQPYGLTELEFRALVLVYAQREVGAFPGDLCVNIGQSPATITRLTDALVNRELITRVPDAADRRRLLLQTTPKGNAMTESLLPLMRDLAYGSYQRFSEHEIAQLLASLKQLAAAMDQIAQDGPRAS